MGILRVMTAGGDEMVRWGPPAADTLNTANTDTGRTDADQAAAAVEEAERIFEKARATGGTAFRVVSGQPAERLDEFDPAAELIVVVPRLAGGAL